MDHGSVNDVSQHISYFYGQHYFLSNRRWRMRGIKFTDLKKGRLDLPFMEKVFDDCKNDPMPSRLASMYLMYFQVLAVREKASVSPSTFRGIHSQEIYDRLTWKSLTFHKRIQEPDGTLKKAFTANPAARIYSMMLRIIKDVIYDLYRFEIESSKNIKTAKMRTLDRRASMARATKYCSTRDLEEWMDTVGIDPFDNQGVEQCQ